MTIKYCEVTVIRNIEEEQFVSYIKRLAGYENRITDKDTIIIKFVDNNTIYDVKNEYADKKFKFAVNHWYYNYPIYFELKNNLVFFKEPTKSGDKNRLDFSEIHKHYPNYEINLKKNLEPSIYNIIYDSQNKVVFSIARIKSNEEKPRFIVSYDDKCIDKSDIIYLIDYMLKQKYSSNTEV